MERSKKQVADKIMSIHEVNPKGDLKLTMVRTVAEAAVSVIGGGLIGTLLGKPSFFVGLGVAGYGFYKDIYWLAPIGLGMMSTSVFLPPKNKGAVSGFDLNHETSNAKDRLLSFKDGIMHKTYLDKLIPSKKANASSQQDEDTAGFGSTASNLNALDEIEKQLNASANAYYAKDNNRLNQPNASAINGITEEADFSGM
jgi:hypothetical protein